MRRTACGRSSRRVPGRMTFDGLLDPFLELVENRRGSVRNAFRRDRQCLLKLGRAPKESEPEYQGDEPGDRTERRRKDETLLRIANPRGNDFAGHTPEKRS